MTGALRRAVARWQWELVAIAVFAFAARLTYRVAQGEEAFLENGYTFYRELADSFLRGFGLCFEGGVDCAVRVPGYPLFMSAFLHWDWLYPGLPIVQAAISTSRCLLAYGIGATLFDRRAGLVAAGLAAIHPYSVAHSTAMQDTSLFNLLMALSVYLLLRSRDPGKGGSFQLAAGAVLAAAMLTSLRLTLFLPLALWWVALPSVPGTRWRWREAALVSIPVALLLGGWVARNWGQVGSPVLTTESGVSLWVAHNSATVEFLPDQSVDEIYDEAYRRLPDDRKLLLDSLTSEVEVDRLLAQWAFEYMRANPGETLLNMARKVAWAFSGQLSPARDSLVQWGYAAYAIPLHLLAVFSWWRSRGGSQPVLHLLVSLLFVAFIITTAVFWSHTSHKSTLHLFLNVYAAFVITSWLPRPAVSRE
ncbi:MAG: glycosyltransferase family 39 protein [Vicinamibacterales bacterium]